MLRAFKYRIYPTRVQATELGEMLKHCRELYNAALEERIESFKHFKRTGEKSDTGVYAQQRSLGEVKDHRPEFAKIHSQVLQDVLKRLDKAFQGFFRRVKLKADSVGFPRFQGRNRFNSITFPQAGTTGAKFVENRLKLYGVGGTVKVRLHRELEGTLKTIAVKREGENWYAVCTCECEAKPLPSTGNSVGVDLGLTHFLITSDGEFVENPRPRKSNAKRLRIAQRRVSRGKRNSNRQRKAKSQVRNIHRKTANTRKDFHHKTALNLVKHADFIAVENLNIKGLSRGILSTSVTDVGWRAFLDILIAKAEYAGRTVLKVSPNHTSQDCSTCGYREKHALHIRTFTCASCGAEHQRDHNAAKNILARGMEQPKYHNSGWLNPSGANVAVVNTQA